MIPPLATSTALVINSDTLRRQADMAPSRDPPVVALNTKTTRLVTRTRNSPQKFPSTKSTAVVETSDNITKTRRGSSRTQREELRTLRDIRRSFLSFELWRTEIESGERGLGAGADGAVLGCDLIQTTTRINTVQNRNGDVGAKIGRQVVFTNQAKSGMKGVEPRPVRRVLRDLD